TTCRAKRQRSGNDMSTRKDKTPKTKSQAKHGAESASALLSDTLPLPDPRFRGRIGNPYADSEADVISLPAPPAGAPNVLLVLLDDVGFGQASNFGGADNTRTSQKMAH